MTFAQLIKQIESGKLAPVYLVYGAEPYFRDKIVKALEATVLQPHERDFNQDILYGNDVKAASLLGVARSYPTMAQRRLVILKEAHRINKTELEGLVSYIKAPVETTVLAFIWPHKSKPDGRSAFGKAIMKHAEVFESKPIYDNKVPGWINEMLSAKGFSIAPDALQVVAASLGSNLQLIESELDKILLHLRLQKQTQITKPMVHEFIGIDKDFNVFELQDALGKGQSARAQTIARMMMKNTKENPPILLVAQLFAYYQKLGMCIQAGARDEHAIAKVLGMSPFIARNYTGPVGRNSLASIHRALELIYTADLQLKGIHQTSLPATYVFETLMLKLLMPAQVGGNVASPRTGCLPERNHG